MLEFLTYHSYDSLSTNFPTIWNEETRQVRYECQKHQAINGIIQTYHFIGIVKRMETHWSHSHGSREMVQYDVYLRESLNIDAPVYCFTATNVYKDCPSGDTSTTWGNFEALQCVSTEPERFHYTLDGEPPVVKFQESSNLYPYPYEGFWDSSDEFTAERRSPKQLILLGGNTVIECDNYGEYGTWYYAEGKSEVRYCIEVESDCDDDD